MQLRLGGVSAMRAALGLSEAGYWGAFTMLQTFGLSEATLSMYRFRVASERPNVCSPVQPSVFRMASERPNVWR